MPPRLCGADCADVRNATGCVIARQMERNTELRRSVERGCKVCGDSCEQHRDMHEHCRVCTEACRRCGAL